jgi:Protein of unknown function (DUF3592)
MSFCNSFKNPLRYRYFWIYFIICLCLTGLFTGLTVLFANLQNNYKQKQNEIYKPVYVKVIGYRALNEGCACGCTGVHSRECYCAFPYNGAILLSYTVNNNTYYGQNKVECGGTVDDAINNAKSAYPLGEKLKMYYDSQAPQDGVVFNIDDIGTYWVGAMLFGLFAAALFFITLLTFVSDYKNTPLCCSSYEEINESF